MALRGDVIARRGFTLVELMVAMVILVLLVIMFSQVIGMTARAWLEGRSRVDNYTRARAMLDLITHDLQTAILRSDIAAFVDASGKTVDASGNPIYAFYTQRSGVASSPVRNISLVGYSLNKSSALLQRGDLAVSWSGVASLISFGQSTSLPQLNNTSFTYRSACPGVVAFRMVFFRADGNTDTIFPTQATGGSSDTLAVADTAKVNSMTYAVKAVGVTLAVIDQATQTRLASKQNALGSDGVWAIPQTGTLVSGGHSVKSIWESNLQGSTTFYQTYPVGGDLKILERYIPLTSGPISL